MKNNVLYQYVVLILSYLVFVPIITLKAKDEIADMSNNPVIQMAQMMKKETPQESQQKEPVINNKVLTSGLDTINILILLCSQAEKFYTHINDNEGATLALLNQQLKHLTKKLSQKYKSAEINVNISKKIGLEKQIALCKHHIDYHKKFAYVMEEAQKLIIPLQQQLIELLKIGQRTIQEQLNAKTSQEINEIQNRSRIDFTIYILPFALKFIKAAQYPDHSELMISLKRLCENSNNFTSYEQQYKQTVNSLNSEITALKQQKHKVSDMK